MAEHFGTRIHFLTWRAPVFKSDRSEFKRTAGYKVGLQGAVQNSF